MDIAKSLTLEHEQSLEEARLLVIVQVVGEGDLDQSAEIGLVARPVSATQQVIGVERVDNLQVGSSPYFKETTLWSKM